MNIMPKFGYQVFVSGQPVSQIVNSFEKASKAATKHRNKELELPAGDPRHLRSEVSIVDFSTDKVTYWSEVRRFGKLRKRIHKIQAARTKPNAKRR